MHISDRLMALEELGFYDLEYDHLSNTIIGMIDGNDPFDLKPYDVELIDIIEVEEELI